MVLRRVRAGLLNSEALDAARRGERDEAVRLYEEAIEHAPDWDVPWFNLGLVYKRERAWSKALTANERAAAAIREQRGEPALWNLGIAATATGAWRTARRAWRAFGMAGIADGDAPLEMELGVVPIRIAAETSAEVVWCDRIDPARAIIRNVPTPASCRRYGDVLLHDGAPNGYREFGGREVPVFDELERLTPSELATFRVSLRAATPADVTAFVDLFSAGDQAAEDWSNVRMLCDACSKGRPHADHGHHRDDGGWAELRTLGVAARTEDVIRARIARWASVGSGREGLAVERAF